MDAVVWIAIGILRPRTAHETVSMLRCAQVRQAECRLPPMLGHVRPSTSLLGIQAHEGDLPGFTSQGLHIIDTSFVWRTKRAAAALIYIFKNYT